VRGTLQPSVGAGGDVSNNSIGISNFHIWMSAFHLAVKRFRGPQGKSIARTDMERFTDKPPT
jgi:hypothetical protein